MIGYAKIMMKLPSLNEYINKCRYNRYAGNTMKKQIEKDIKPYIQHLPEFTKPVKIEFRWFESNKRRDLDNVVFAKKFILDCLVANHKLINDNQKYVIAFKDTLDYAKTAYVEITIEEI